MPGTKRVGRSAHDLDDFPTARHQALAEEKVRLENGELLEEEEDPYDDEVESEDDEQQPSLMNQSQALVSRTANLNVRLAMLLDQMQFKPLKKSSSDKLPGMAFHASLKATSSNVALAHKQLDELFAYLVGRS